MYALQLIPDRHDSCNKTPFLRHDASGDGVPHRRVLYEFLVLVHEDDGAR